MQNQFSTFYAMGKAIETRATIPIGLGARYKQDLKCIIVLLWLNLFPHPFTFQHELRYTIVYWYQFISPSTYLTNYSWLSLLYLSVDWTLKVFFRLSKTQCQNDLALAGWPLLSGRLTMIVKFVSFVNI